MTLPVVGVIGNSQVVNDRYNVQSVGQRNLRAIAEVAGALPLMFPGIPEVTDIGSLLDAGDGILLTGARANVHPSCFGVEPHPQQQTYDQERDAGGPPPLQAAGDPRGPLLGLYRGFPG